jgi:DNA-binding winged helix-turn-helix (wHTH) protein
MTRSIHRTGDFRIDPVARELWRGDRLIELPPHVFDCLAYLLEHRDRAVGRDELVAAVWGRTEVSDTLLGQTMLRIRRELGDDGKEQRVVRTIPRFGYRWVGPLDDAGDSGAIPVAPAAAIADASISDAAAVAPAAVTVEVGTDDASASTRAKRPIRLALIALAVVAAFLAILFGWRYRSEPARPHPAAESITVAVMPAEVQAEADWSWLRFGVMDVVATHLRSSGVPTVPSENIIALLNAPARQRSASLRDAAGFGLLVSPQVVRGNDGWRVRLDADDGAGQHHVAEASAHDATEAARLAADQLLVKLGRVASSAGVEGGPDVESLRPIDAAILADDPATARALIEQMPAAGRNAPELRLRLAKIDFRGGHTDAARDRLLGLLDEASAETAPALRAAVLNGLGSVAIRSDQAAQAETYFAQAIDLLATRSDPRQLGEAYLGRAGAAKEQGHYDAASADYARARIALKQANDTLALLRVAANEGFMDLEQGRPAQALPELAAAGKGFEQWGALNEAIFSRIGEIGCALALLDPAAAMDTADAAAPLAARIDNQGTRDSLTIARAKALAANGRLREARDLLVQLHDANPAPDDVTAAVAAVPLARLELDAGHFELAAKLAGTAVDALVQAGYASLRAQAWLVRIRALSRVNDVAAAAAQLDLFDGWAGQGMDHPAKVRAQLARAELAPRPVDGRDWRRGFERARELAEQRAVPADLALVASAYAQALIAAGDLEAAAVEVGRLSRWADSDFDSAVLEARLQSALGRNVARQAAVARARALAGERAIPADALAIPISTPSAAAR